MSEKQVVSVLELLDPPTGFKPWHGGPTLMGCLRGVHAEEAAWKPAPDRHSIWELALHIAYWKYRVRRYINANTPKEFGRSPADWPEIDRQTENQWKTDKNFIRQEHEMLIKAIRNFPIGRLDEKIKERKEWTYRQLLDGIAAHDTYHIGQIQLMKRLYNAIAKKKG